jgi:hypothetical protein
MYVRQFGQPVRNNGRDDNNQPRNNGSTFGANVNAPGVNFNISINDPDLNGNSGNNNGNHNNHGNHQGNQGGNNNGNSNSNTNNSNCRGLPINSADFLDAKKSITQSNFDETKLSTAKSILSSNCVSVDQVISICNLFSFEDNKLEFAKFAYGRTTDPKNYFKVINVFSFSDNKEELSDYIQKQR